MPIKRHSKGIYGIFPLKHKNAFRRKQGPFRQGQCDFGEERGTEVCRIHKFPDNQKKYLPKKADCMVSYRYNSFQVDMVNCFSSTQFYHKPVRSCSILAKKKPDFMRAAAFRKRL